VTLAPTAPWTQARATAAIAPSLTEVRRLGVAFSGGVDSSVLLALAAEALGRGQVLAVLGYGGLAWTLLLPVAVVLTAVVYGGRRSRRSPALD